MKFIVVGNPLDVGIDYTKDGASWCYWHSGDGLAVALVLSDSTRSQLPIYPLNSLLLQWTATVRLMAILQGPRSSWGILYPLPGTAQKSPLRPGFSESSLN
jgi:hypothetical protein